MAHVVDVRMAAAAKRGNVAGRLDQAEAVFLQVREVHLVGFRVAAVAIDATEPLLPMDVVVEVLLRDVAVERFPFPDVLVAVAQETVVHRLRRRGLFHGLGFVNRLAHRLVRPGLFNGLWFVHRLAHRLVRRGLFNRLWFFRGGQRPGQWNQRNGDGDPQENSFCRFHSQNSPSARRDERGHCPRRPAAGPSSAAAPRFPKRS